jgi:hypothetical protein
MFHVEHLQQRKKRKVKTPQGYPAIAVMEEFNFITNTHTRHEFNTYQQALDYWNTHKAFGRVHFSPIKVVEVAR